MSFTWLPPLLNTIADVAGNEAALALARARGGSRVSIPARAKDDHWLVEVVGREAADKICDHFRVGTNGTGVALDIPTGPESPMNKLLDNNRKSIDQMLADGVSVDLIARRVRVHRTTVFRRKAKTGIVDTRQSDLFDN